MLRRSFLVAIALLGHIGVCEAAVSSADLACIDRAGNNNGLIDSKAEILTTALHVDKTFREQDKSCDGKISRAELNAWLAKKKKSLKVQLAVRDLERKVIAVSLPTADTKPSGTAQEAAHLEHAGEWTQPKGSGQIYLRRDFQDLFLFSDPKPTGSGAEFAVTSDLLAENRSISAKGVAFWPLVFDRTWEEKQRDRPYLARVSLTPSLRFEYLSNSDKKLKKRNIEIVTPGLTAEAEVGNLLGFSHYARARASLVTSTGHSESWQLRGEWQPIEPSGRFCVGSPCPLFGSPLLFRFDPKVVAEHAVAIGRVDPISEPLFSKKDYASRVGVSLPLKVYPNLLLRKELPIYLQYVDLSISYTAYQDLAIKSKYSLFDAVLTLKNSPDDRIGISLSYTRGNVEDTGQPINAAKIGVAAKF